MPSIQNPACEMTKQAEQCTAPECLTVQVPLLLRMGHYMPVFTYCEDSGALPSLCVQLQQGLIPT